MAMVIKKNGGPVNAVSKSALKSKMLSYFRQVEKTHEPLIVLDNHKPVLKIIPYQEKKPFRELFADMQGQMKSSSPLEKNTSSEWGQLR